jgi:hypothetical protein
MIAEVYCLFSVSHMFLVPVSYMCYYSNSHSQTRRNRTIIPTRQTRKLKHRVSDLWKIVQQCWNLVYCSWEANSSTHGQKQNPCMWLRKESMESCKFPEVVQSTTHLVFCSFVDSFKQLPPLWSSHPLHPTARFHAMNLPAQAWHTVSCCLCVGKEKVVVQDRKRQGLQGTSKIFWQHCLSFTCR